MDVCDAGQPVDRALVAAAQSGSARAFDLLVERHHPPLLRYLTRQTGDRELAADLAQETFLDAFRSLQRLADDRSFAAWLYRIARHNLLAALRRRRLHRLVSLDWLLAQPQRAEALGLIPDWSDELAACRDRELLERLFDELSPALREALLLAGAHGFTSREVALILGISPAAARQRVARAKERVRLGYQAHTGGDDDADL